MRTVYALARGPISSPDTGGYRAAAAAWLEGDLQRAIDLPPTYPLLIAAVPEGGSLLVLNVLLSSAVAPLAAMAAWRHFGPWAGALTALLVAVNPAFILWVPYLLTDTLALFLLALLLERSSALWATFSPLGALQVGIVIGLGVLTRAAFGGLAFAVVLVAVVQARWRSALLAMVAAAGIVAIPAALNAAAVGELVPYRSQTWFLLWAGTMWTEEGRGTSGVDILYPAGHDTWDSVQRDAYYRTETLAALRERPDDLVALVLKKAFWFWLPAYPEWSATHKAVRLVYLLPLYAAAIYAAFSHKHVAFTWVLVGALLGLTALTAVTIVDYDARYRLPGELAVIVLASAGIVALGSRVRALRRATRT